MPLPARDDIPPAYRGDALDRVDASIAAWFSIGREARFEWNLRVFAIMLEHPSCLYGGRSTTDYSMPKQPGGYGWYTLYKCRDQCEKYVE
jgi:hypothetical protein